MISMIDFSEPEHDYLQILNNGIIGQNRFSGKHEPFYFISKRSNVDMIFYSDENVEKVGFSLSVIATDENGMWYGGPQLSRHNIQFQQPIFTTQQPIFTTQQPIFTTQQPFFTTQQPISRHNTEFNNIFHATTKHRDPKAIDHFSIHFMENFVERRKILHKLWYGAP